MDIVIEQGGKQLKIAVQDMLRGLQTTNEEDETVKLHPGILSIKKFASGALRVVVRERYINREVLHRGAASVQNASVDGVANRIKTRQAIIHVAQKYLEDNRLMYKTRKGAVFQIDFLQDGKGMYKPESKGMKIYRDVASMKNEEKSFIYPNVNGRGLICQGSITYPKITELSEVGKITSQFFASKVNTDWGVIWVRKGNWINFIDELLSKLERVDKKYRKDVEQALLYLKTEKQPQIVKPNVYFFMLMVNVFQLDMDWAHAVLFGK